MMAKVNKSKEVKKPNDRGEVRRIELSKAITFNGHLIKFATIEIEHVNKGLDEITGELKEKKRTHFTLKEIEKFISLVDNEHIAATRYKGSSSIFLIKVNCPIKRLHFDKLFMMILEHDHFKKDEIYTVTIYPLGW